MQDHITDEINTLGSKLSLIISCPVTYPGFDKHMFKCIKHECSFPVYRLKGSVLTGDWEWCKEVHDEFGQAHR